MAWPTDSTGVTTANLDSASDNPASARAEIYNGFLELQKVIDGRGQASGVAALDASSYVAQSQINPTITTSSTDITLSPNTNMVQVNNFLNLNPVAYASLPSSPAMGDIAFLTTDGGGATQNQPIYYNGTRWNYFNNTANGGTDAAVATS
tara:strand:- start:840 stop:1289 length:450 start_codon:yes stop_codon:yes gene_type:complete